MNNDFFNESKDQSKAKTAIVSKYFLAWATIISGKNRAGRICYLDLFAGPGRYEDGTKSTPLIILENALLSSRLKDQLVCYFNDKDEDNTQQLQVAIQSIPGIENLQHQPVVQNQEVGTELVKLFSSMHLIPTFFFVDPWGYKGLSLGLVNSVIKDWACECVFFFNYNRINMGLSNPKVKQHMDVLFGENEANELRKRLPGYNNPCDRELDIVETLAKSLNPDGTRYILPFTFRNEAGNRTSHHLIFVSKHPLGYTIMKEVMARESTSTEQGVASFMYNPADDRFPILFEYGKPLDSLKSDLLSEFEGRSITVSALFDSHHIGTPFILKNYKRAIMELQSQGEVVTNRTPSHVKRGQCPDATIVTFPGTS